MSKKEIEHTITRGLMLFLAKYNFVLVIFTIHGRNKKDFLKVVKLSYRKNRFLVFLRSFFST